MSVMTTKDNGNAPATRTARRASPASTPFGFPDIFGMSRALDALLATTTTPNLSAVAFPAIDISEENGNYVIEAAIPGFNKDDIAIEVANNQVTISGEHDEKQDDRKRRYSEIRRAAFSRTIVLPRDVTPDSARATFEDGVLKITLEPTQPLGSKRVPIEGSSSGSGSSESSSSVSSSSR